MKLGILGTYTKYILMNNRQIQRTHYCNDSRRRKLCEQTFRQIVPTTLTNMRLETVSPFLHHQHGHTKNLIFLRPLAKWHIRSVDAG